MLFLKAGHYCRLTHNLAFLARLSAKLHDSSQLAERAIPVAARIARATGAEVLLFQAVMLPTYGYGPYFIQTPVMAPENILEADVANATAYLRRIAASSDLVGIKTTIKVETGTATATIFATAQESMVDLIVICSRGQTGLKRWMLGSIAQKVVRQSSIPVLVLRDDETSRPGAVGVHQYSYNEHPLRILVPLDGSALAKAVAVPAAQLAAALVAPGKGALHLTRVVKRDTLPREGNLDESTKELLLHKAKQYLADAAVLVTMTPAQHSTASSARSFKTFLLWSRAAQITHVL